MLYNDTFYPCIKENNCNITLEKVSSPESCLNKLNCCCLVSHLDRKLYIDSIVIN